MALLTPVVKAANNAVQVLGGYGCVTSKAWSSLCATPAPRRSTRAPTASRRLTSWAASWARNTGRSLRGFFHPVAVWLEAHAEDEALAAYAGPTAKAFGRLQQVSLVAIAHM